MEIGTRRALGAKVIDLFAQILMEAALLSFVGCALGLLLGWHGSHVVAERANLPFEFDWANARLAVLSAAVMNLSFALLPAARAARVSPVCALRHE